MLCQNNKPIICVGGSYVINNEALIVFLNSFFQNEFHLAKKEGGTDIKYKRLDVDSLQILDHNEESIK